jgi:hypothetical protein
MATAFTLPDLGENIDSGDVVSVLVAPGDTVKPGQAVLEVETDKAVIEVPCPPGGVVKEVRRLRSARSCCRLRQQAPLLRLLQPLPRLRPRPQRSLPPLGQRRRRPRSLLLSLNLLP